MKLYTRYIVYNLLSFFKFTHTKLNVVYDTITKFVEAIKIQITINYNMV